MEVEEMSDYNYDSVKQWDATNQWCKKVTQIKKGRYELW